MALFFFARALGFPWLIANQQETPALIELKYVMQVVDILFSLFHVELIGVLVIARNSPLFLGLSNPIMQI